MHAQQRVNKSTCSAGSTHGYTTCTAPYALASTLVALPGLLFLGADLCWLSFASYRREGVCFVSPQVMIGGEWFESLLGDPADVSEEALAEVAVQELENHLGIVEKPSVKLSRIHKVHSMCPLHFPASSG